MSTATLSAPDSQLVTYGQSDRIFLNVFYELPDLIIQPDVSGVPGNPPWEFTFKERDVMGLPLMELKKKFFDEQDTMFLLVDYMERKDRDDKVLAYKPHCFAVQHVYPNAQCDEATKPLVYTALVYRVAAQMDMLLRQSCFRQADPGIHRATLRDYHGKVLASALASQFMPYALAPKKS